MPKNFGSGLRDKVVGTQPDGTQGGGTISKDISKEEADKQIAQLALRALRGISRYKDSHRSYRWQHTRNRALALRKPLHSKRSLRMAEQDTLLVEHRTTRNAPPLEDLPRSIGLLKRALNARSVPRKPGIK